MATEQQVLEHLKWVTAELRQTRARVKELEGAEHAPVAVVGVACRFPGGVTTPEDLWRLVDERRDAVGEVPAERGWDTRPWYHPDPAHPGTSYVRDGGFLTGAGGFDAPFFRISPREALAMDPQQRLLLEASWEAFERAGIDPASLHGRPVGVFAGGAYVGYGSVDRAAADGTEGLVTTGSSPAVIAGRISYTFGFGGPAVTVDTMCSSSLVALHLACQSLRRGECDTALAAGAAVITGPAEFIEFSRQQALAPDGRCKPFSAAADGTGWAEGAAVLLLEPLATARRLGHPVWGVVRGSAVNHDGASNGLTAPSGPAQRRVLGGALADAGLTAHDIDLVEAHGTGTTLGDPIEARALQDVYGRHRQPDRPLWIGSVKSNIGHTQAASGMAGVVKVLMAMRHGTMPASLHADEPTREVDWTAGTVRVLDRARPWPRGDRPRRAGVSSFGASGTNAHVIVEEPGPVPADAGAPADAEAPHARRQFAPAVWPLSAAGLPALRAAAGRLADRLERLGPDPHATGHALAAGRHAFAQRAVVLAPDLPGLGDGLRNLADGSPHPGVVTGLAHPDPRVVFVFPGQGSQWAGMAVGLLAADPVFAEALDACEKALSAEVDWSLTDVLHERPGAPGLDRADVVQPALWAVMVALAAVWRHHGVQPAAVIGHSQGEIAAACVAGVLCLEDGAHLVCTRSRLIAERLAGGGAMVSVRAGAPTVRQWIDAAGAAVSIAAVNGPTATVVSGETAGVDAFLDHVPEDRVRRINVDYASHSAHVDPIEQELAAAVAGIAPRAGDVRVYSTVTGGAVDGTAMDSGYWWRNLRGTVRFEDAVRQATADGHTLFVEISTHPVLVGALSEITEDGGEDVTAIGTLRRGEDDRERLPLALAEAWAHGAPVDWPAALGRPGTHPGEAAGTLPTYPFQRRHYWLPPAVPGADPGEQEFWDAVGRQDAAAAARAVEADDDTERAALGQALPLLGRWRRRHEDEHGVRRLTFVPRWVPRSDGDPARTAGHWLVLAPAGGPAERTAAECARVLTGHGAEAEVVTADATTADRATLRQLLAGHPAATAVLSLLALDDRPHPAAAPLAAGTVATLALLQELAEARRPAPLWCLTRGAVATGTGDAAPRADQAQVWGLGRTAALEHPQTWGGLIDLPPDGPVPDGLAAALAAGDEDQLAVRGGALLVRRIVPAPPPPAAETPWTPAGTVLVTGATGTLGGRIARHLADNGATHLVFTTRRDPGHPAVTALAADLGERGVASTAVSCDLSSRDGVLHLAHRLAREGLTPTAVFHTAGGATLAPLARTTPDMLRDTCAVRVEGARHLDEAFADPGVPLVCFSSVTSEWGGGDHGAYAAAGAALDAVARQRRARDLPAVTASWSVWALPPAQGDADAADGSRATSTAETSASPTSTLATSALAGQPARQGLPPLDPQQATAVLETLLAGPLTGGGDTTIVADVDWERFLPLYTLRRPTRLFDAVPRARTTTTPAADDADDAGDSGAADDLRRRLAALDPEGRTALLLETVREHCAAALRLPSADAVEPGRPLRELGFDSVMSIDLRNRLALATGTRLRASLVFDFPTPLALAGHLTDRVLPPAEPAAYSLGDAVEAVEAALLAPELRGDTGTTGTTGDTSTLVQRLESALSGWRARRAGEAPDDALDEATDSELFAFIHGELGKPLPD